jgi:hypothetical protein
MAPLNVRHGSLPDDRREESRRGTDPRPACTEALAALSHEIGKPRARLEDGDFSVFKEERESCSDQSLPSA